MDESGHDLYEIGSSTRRAVLGDRHVDTAEERSSPLEADFQRFITEMAWGSVWSRPGLDRRTRSLVTIALLAGLGRAELALHLRAASNCGVEVEEIVETLLHVAVYAGVPVANTAFSALKEIERDPAPELGDH